MQLKYCEIYTLYSDSVAGNICGTQQAVRLNSLYDPNLTGAGHQPYGFDQLTPLYKSYKVHTALVDILVTTPGGTHDMQCCALVQGPNGGETLTGMYGFVAEEHPNVETRHLSISGSRQARFRFRVPMAGIIGITKKQFDADINFYASAVTTNPALAVTLCMGVNCPDNTTSQASTWRVCITYIGDMWDRVGQASS